MLFQTENDDFFSLPEDEEVAADYIGNMGRQFQEAFVQRKADKRLTQQQIADRLGVHRSVVNRYFSGFSNLTAETQAKLAWALGGRACFTILMDDEALNNGANYFVGSASLETISSPRVGNQVHLSPAPKAAITSAGINVIAGSPSANKFGFSK